MGEGRIVLHVDMDAFYASVETMHRPELRDVPVVIGADPQGGSGRGVVSTANYHARRFGIRSGIPISVAYRACPDARFLRPDFRKYKPASEDAMQAMAPYADVFEIVGMDEAYLDITECVNGDWSRVSAYCRSLQAAVRRATGLACSVGAAPTKSSAKIASDFRKPHGVTVVPPSELKSFLDPLPLGLINGCGPKLSDALAESGYRTIGDLARADHEYITSRHGKHGEWVWNVAHGNDPRVVRASRGPAKSRGNERTYPRDERDATTVFHSARALLQGLLANETDGRAFSTLTVKVRYSDFTTLTRSHTLSIPLDPAAYDAKSLAMVTMDSLLRPLLDGRPIRLVGVRLSGFTNAPGQRTLSHFGASAPAMVPVPS